MPTPSPSLPEVLIARKIPWRKRLWVQIALLLAVTSILLAGIWYWPRRGMATVWAAGGEVGKSVLHGLPNHPLVDQIDRWFFSGQLQDHVWHLEEYFQTDQDIGIVDLELTPVDDLWLRRLNRFPNLDNLTLHDRQLGRGLENLRGHLQLEHVTIDSVSDNHLAFLEALPQLESILIKNMRTNDVALHGLARLPRLKHLLFAQCRQTRELLSQCPELLELESLVISHCTEFSDDDLQHLKRFPKLTSLMFFACKIGEKGFLNLAALQNLKELQITRPDGSSPICDDELESLGKLTNLKELSIYGAGLTTEQKKVLEKHLPETELSIP